jgi:hypothetical protein
VTKNFSVCDPFFCPIFFVFSDFSFICDLHEIFWVNDFGLIVEVLFIQPYSEKWNIWNRPGQSNWITRLKTINYISVRIHFQLDSARLQSTERYWKVTIKLNENENWKTMMWLLINWGFVSINEYILKIRSN